MRTIDVTGLKVVAQKPNRMVWRLSDETLLRAGTDTLTAEGAEERLSSYAAVRNADVPAAAPIEVVRVTGDPNSAAFGVVVEYVTGMDLGMLTFFGAYSVDELAEEVVGVWRKIASRHVAERIGIDWNAALVDRAHAAAARMGTDAGERLVGLVEAIPTSDTLVHGDLHPANIILHDGTPTLIDLDNAGFGNPCLDLAIMRERSDRMSRNIAPKMGLGGDEAAGLGMDFWQIALARALGDADAGKLNEADRRLRILSCLEAIRLCTGGSDEAPLEMAEHLEAQVRDLVAAIEDDLSSVSRLDLGDLV